MSNNSEESGPPTKKFKNDHDDENVWGEELDENTVEECLFLASQVLSEQPTPEPSTCKPKFESTKQESTSSKSSPEVFKKPSVPSLFKPKRPSLIASSNSTVKKYPSSSSPIDKFTRKISATSSQSQTFPKQSHGIAKPLQVYPRKSPTSSANKPVSTASKATVLRSVQIPYSRHTEPSASKESPFALRAMGSSSKPGLSSLSSPTEQSISVSKPTEKYTLSGSRVTEPNISVSRTLENYTSSGSRLVEPNISVSRPTEKYTLSGSRVTESNISVSRPTEKYTLSGSRLAEPNISVSRSTEKCTLSVSSSIEQPAMSSQGYILPSSSSNSNSSFIYGKEDIFVRPNLHSVGTSRDTSSEEGTKFLLKSSPIYLDTSMFVKPESDKSKDDLIEELNQLKIANKKLKDDLLSKDGEVAILRTKMKTLQLDLTQQQQSRVQQLQKQSDVFQEEVKRLKKNLEQKETLLEFKRLETDRVKEKCLLLGSQANLKFVEPQSPQVSGSFAENAIPSTSTAEKPKKEEKVEKQGKQEKQTEKTRNPKIKHFCNYFQVSFFRSDCYTLISHITKFIFEPTLHNTHEEKVKYIPYRYSRFHGDTLTPQGVSVKVLYRHIGKLFVSSNFSVPRVKIVIQNVIWESFMILWKQLYWLKKHRKDFSSRQWDKLDYNVYEEAGRVYKQKYYLLSAEKFYDHEQSIEIRRTLAFLEILARINDYAAQYMSGNIKNKFSDPAMRSKRETVCSKKNKKSSNISSELRKRIKEDARLQALEEKRRTEEEERQKKLHEQAMNDEMRTFSFKREDLENYNPDRKWRKPDLISSLRNYAVRCWKQNVLCNLPHPMDLSIRPHERRELLCDDDADDNDESEGGQMDHQPFQRPSKNMYLIHPVEWRLAIHQNVEIGYMIKRRELKWTLCKKIVDEKIKNFMPSPREKSERLKKMLEEQKATGINQKRLNESENNIIPPFDEPAKEFDFLEFLYEMSEIICSWKFTVPMNSVLLAMAMLVTSILSKARISENRYPVLIKLIRELICCRPSINVMIELVRLLNFLSNVELIQESLCTGSGPYVPLREGGATIIIHKAVPHYEIIKVEDVYRFPKTSCLIPMLAYLICIDRADIFHQAKLGYHVVSWMRNAALECGSSGPNWIGPAKNKELRDCQCRVLIIEALIKLMYTCYDRLVHICMKRDNTYQMVNAFLGSSMLFIKFMISYDIDMGILMSNSEGQYLMIIYGLWSYLDKLEFTENQKTALKMLIELENQRVASLPKIDVSEKSQRLLKETFEYADEAIYFDFLYDGCEPSDTDSDS